MKTLGIIGEMSPESTITYYQGINQLINQNYGKNQPALILLNSVEFDQIIEYQKSGNWQKAGKVLAQAARVLQNSGADTIVLATNTMHKVSPQIIETTTIPFLHIIDATSQAILQRELHKIGLLIQQNGCKLPFFDTALLHIQAAADFLLSGE